MEHIVKVLFNKNNGSCFVILINVILFLEGQTVLNELIKTDRDA